MKCPHCDKEILGKTCPDCGETMPEEAQYCMRCGSLLVAHDDDVDFGSGDIDELDFENRVLCPDGTCTGIIVDGKCTECGKSFTPEELSGDNEEDIHV